MKNKITLLVGTGLLVLLPACSPMQWLKDKFGGAKKEEAVSVSPSDDTLVNEGEVLVTMNGKAIVSSKSLDRDFEQLLTDNPQLQQVLPLMPGAKENFMHGMVSQAVVNKYVADNGIDRSPEYLEEEARMQKSVKYMLNTKYYGKQHAIEVTEAEVEKFYNNNKDSMPDLVMSRGGVKAMGVPFAKEDAARSFVAKLKGRDFAKVAKEVGLTEKMRDFKMVNGQSIGIDNAVKNRIVSMKQCPCVEVVKGDDKMFWVVSATEKQDVAYRPLEQVKAGLKQYMEKEKRMAVLDKEINTLKEQYNVVVNQNYFSKPTDAQMAEQSGEEAPQALAQQVSPAQAT